MLLLGDPGAAAPESVGNADSQDPAQTHRVRICTLTRVPGGLHAHYSLRNTGKAHSRCPGAGKLNE